jgi:hypothetical protein
MKTSAVRHASVLLGLFLAVMLAVACTAPSGGASGAPPVNDPPVESEPASAEPAPAVDDYEY